MNAYNLYIDESGDEGIDLTNKNQSKYFCLGAFLVKEENQSYCKNIINEIEDELEKAIHFSSLNHEKKKFVCSKISKLPVRFLGSISAKEGLNINSYDKQIKLNQKINNQKGYFYNKNVKYLLERVLRYSNQNNLEVKNVIFEKVNNKNYSQLKNFLIKCGQNPLHKNATVLEKVKDIRFLPLEKHECSLLKISDSYANALYRLITPDIYGQTEDAYVKMLACKIAKDSNGNFIDAGISTFPPSLRQNLLFSNVNTFIKKQEDQNM